MSIQHFSKLEQFSLKFTLKTSQIEFQLTFKFSKKRHVTSKLKILQTHRRLGDNLVRGDYFEMQKPKGQISYHAFEVVL